MTTTTAEAALAAEVALWLEQYTTASQQVQAGAAAAAASSWLSFEDWYKPAAVAAMAAQMASASKAAQQVTSGLSSQYLANVIAAITGKPVALPRRVPVKLRNGVDLNLVHMRPAEAYKRAIATGLTHSEALIRAGLRAANVSVTDLTLTDRGVMQAILQRVGITHYRRMIHPEMSRTGSCGLCIVAADQVYTSGDLMPIHPPHCNCTVMPIIGDNDPGRQLTKTELDRLYADAGSTAAADLKRTRYTVNEHGEFGPVLTKAGDKFRGPDQVALENDPARAQRMLTKMLPVLADLETRAAAGEDVSGPLSYQRSYVDRLRAIVPAA